jgi:MYND finger
MLVNRIHKRYSCKICKKVTNIKACKCQNVYYCSRNCQTIDWSAHRQSCRYIKHDSQSSSNINNGITDGNASENALQHNTNEWNNRERKEYDPTLMQSQYANTNNMNTFNSNNEAVDFEENLFNSLMYSVNESTEQEILKNLNIRTDDFLTTYLEEDISVQTLNKEYVPVVENDDQVINDKFFEQIQRQPSFEFKPDQQKLIRETKEDLEKELSLLRDSNLHEQHHHTIEQTIAVNIDTMQLSSTNPKHVAASDTRLQDNVFAK